MIARILASQFKYNHMVLKSNLEGVSHDESLIQPKPYGNCINWILGHIVAGRNAVLTLIGEEAIWTAEESKTYDRGSDPLEDSSKAQKIESILAALDTTQKQLSEKLVHMRDEDLTAIREPEKGSIADQLAGLSFHESYHSGQIGLLRQLIGKEGTLK